MNAPVAVERLKEVDYLLHVFRISGGCCGGFAMMEIVEVI